MNQQNRQDYFKASKDLYENPDFPFTIFHVTALECIPSGPGYRYLHWHEDLQLTIVIKVSLTAIVDGQTYHLKEGEGIFINSRLLHMTHHLSPDIMYISYNFPPQILSMLLGSTLEQNYVLSYTMNYNLPAIFLTPTVKWQAKMLQELIDLDNFREGPDIYAKDYETIIRLQSVWLHFIRNVQSYTKVKSPTYLRRQESIQTMISYIHSHFSEAITLDTIAASATVSSAECSRLFQKMLRCSPYEYLILYRITKSRDLLVGSDRPITTIAYDVGFNDSSNFIQTFKKRVGVTPGKYRKTRLHKNSAQSRDPI